MGFPRQEHCSGLPFPSPGDLPNPHLLHYISCIIGEFFTAEPPGKQGGSVVNNPSAIAGDTRDVGSIPGLGRSLVEGNGNPLQYSCLGNPMDRGGWWATVHGVAKSQTQLSD